MTYEDAIEIMKKYIDFDEAYTGEYDVEKMAIKAMELQVAKKPKRYTPEDGTAEMYICPNCEEYSAWVDDIEESKEYQQPHCWNCGQKLDWSKV